MSLFSNDAIEVPNKQLDRIEQVLIRIAEAIERLSPPDFGPLEEPKLIIEEVEPEKAGPDEPPAGDAF